MDAKELVNKLNLHEKVSLFVGYDNWRTRKVERLNIPSLRVTDGPHGTRFIPDEDQTVDEGLPAVCFPTASAMAATWNKQLIEQVGVALGQETKAKGAHILLGPAVNIHRTSLGGRNFEYFSEDPFLTGRMAVAYINGLQSQGVGASIKHFACNNSEYERMSISSEVAARALHEIYLPAFRAAVLEAKPWTVMCSYNKINGTYASEHRYLLMTILKEAWDFDGFVVSDWGAVHDRVKAALAGLDLEMPGRPDWFAQELFEAVKKKVVAEKILDDKIFRIFRVMDKAGLFDQQTTTSRENNIAERETIAYHTACEAMVLLKNEGNILPISADKYRKIGVFGYLAEQPTIEGGGSSRVTPHRITKPLDEIKRLANGQYDVFYEPGIILTDNIPVIQNLDRTIELAEKVDIALVFAGLPEFYETEGADRPMMHLPGEYDSWINTILSHNPHTVVVLQSGSPIEMTLWVDQAAGLIEAWYAGQEGGRAVADILFGQVNPSGKLPMTFPRRRIDHSDYPNYPGENGSVLYGEGIFVGYRYYDVKGIEPLFPFGYGLSYSHFEYSSLVLDMSGLQENKAGRVEFEIKNLGKYGGKETAQVYVHDPQSRLIRPVKELKGFEKVWLNPGERKKVHIDLNLWDLAYYDPAEDVWVAECGEYEIRIGSSSRDIHLSGRFILPETYLFNHKGKLIKTKKGFRLSADNLLREILADEGGRKILTKYLGDREKDPRFSLAQGFSLRQISLYAPGEIPPELVAKIDRELRALD
mgnify:CR=1 FL=1